MYDDLEKKMSNTRHTMEQNVKYTEYYFLFYEVHL